MGMYFHSVGIASIFSTTNWNTPKHMFIWERRHRESSQIWTGSTSHLRCSGFSPACSLSWICTVKSNSGLYNHSPLFCFETHFHPWSRWSFKLFWSQPVEGIMGDISIDLSVQFLHFSYSITTPIVAYSSMHWEIGWEKPWTCFVIKWQQDFHTWIQLKANTIFGPRFLFTIKHRF